MRDAHRMKEKLDLTLDSRQLPLVLAGGIALLAAVFALGVVTGKRWAQSPRTQGPDLLTALDRKTEALEQVRKDPPLTFQDELTRKADPIAALAQGPRNTEKPAAAQAQGPVGAKPAELDRAGSQAQGPKAPERRADLTAVSVRSAPPGTAPKHPPETVPNGPFTLQLKASQDRDEATRTAARLRDRGYAPYIVTAEVPGKGTWYRVRMGSFPSKSAAQRYLQDFRRETQLEAFVAATR